MGYIDVAKLMTHEGAVYALQSPGLYEDEEPQFLHYTELVTILLKPLRHSIDQALIIWQGIPWADILLTE